MHYYVNSLILQRFNDLELKLYRYSHALYLLRIIPR